MTLSHILNHLRRFKRDTNGAAMVEFAIALPMLLLVFAITIEGSRLLWSYQAAISGVRDATRYLARIAPLDICDTGGSVAGYDDLLTTVVGKRLAGGDIFPTGVTLVNVTPSLRCVVGTYRVSPAPVARVTADVQIDFPFGSIFGLVGASLSPLTTQVSDESRVFGL
jgi:hypothetical protein